MNIESIIMLSLSYGIGVILCIVYFSNKIQDDSELNTDKHMRIAMLLTLLPGINLICGLFMLLKDMLDVYNKLKNLK